jgi:agmatine deiminase
MTDHPRLVQPEWAPHAALWAGWPRLADEWGGDLAPARAEIAAFLRAASAFVPLKVASGSDEAATTAREALAGTSAEVIDLPTGDIWLRDTGPIITGTGEGREAQVFRFNGWGGKYLMPGDTDTAAALAVREGLPARRHDFILEGGAVDADGEGRLLTTRQCLLNPNRNKGWSADNVQAALRVALGATEIIWLGDGLLNDHTDGHVDNIARFVAPGHVVCQHASGTNDPNAAALAAIERALSAAGLMVSSVPSPGLILSPEGEPVPASHMNFTITNGAVFVPIYEDHFSAVALSDLKALFPGREVIGLAARSILDGGGSFHCMTREVPL